MKRRFLESICVLALLMINYSCKKDDTPANPNAINYVLATTGGTYPTQTTYLFGTNQFPSGSVTTSNAAELSSSGQLFKFGSNVYVSTFGAPATLRKFSFDAAGKPVQAASFSVPGLKTFGTVDFISETEAYAASNGYGGVPKLVKFNPTNMQIASTIDLSSLHKAASVGGDYYLGMVHRDNNLFMGITYTNVSGDPLYDSVFIAIIDKTTGTVSKLISDGRASEMWDGGSAASFSPNCIIKDDNGDIYISGFANNSKPSGVLRIKNGSTSFDPSYFFNLSTATGKPCHGLFYMGAGLVFTLRYADPVAYPFDLDASYNSYAAAEYYKIDLIAQTSAGSISSTLPKIFGNNAFMSKWDDQKIYFNVPAASSNAVYSYKITGGAVTKEFDLSSGVCNGFTKIN